MVVFDDGIVLQFLIGLFYQGGYCVMKGDFFGFVLSILSLGYL